MLGLKCLAFAQAETRRGTRQGVAGLFFASRICRELGRALPGTDAEPKKFFSNLCQLGLELFPTLFHGILSLSPHAQSRNAGMTGFHIGKAIMTIPRVPACDNERARYIAHCEFAVS